MDSTFSGRPARGSGSPRPFDGGHGRPARRFSRPGQRPGTASPHGTGSYGSSQRPTDSRHGQFQNSRGPSPRSGGYAPGGYQAGARRTGTYGAGQPRPYQQGDNRAASPRSSSGSGFSHFSQGAGGRHGGGRSRRPSPPGSGPTPLKAAPGVAKVVKRRPDSEKLAESGNPEALRYAALGGLEEVGRNMMFFEYKDEIVIIDAGLGFGDEETPGVDFIIPNVEYLQARKENIRGMVMTHGHLDHIGALPFIIEKLGNPIIYTTSLTKALIEKRHEEFPNLPKLKFGLIKNRDVVRMGQYFEAEFFGVAHNIPDTTGICLKTPVGNMVHFADFKIDYTDDGQPQGLDEYAAIGAKGIHTLMLDSTNATKPGHSMSEKIVEKNLEDLFKKAPGRVVMVTFSSTISRIAEAIKIAERLGRRVFLNGYSMKQNMLIAQNLGIIKPAQGTLLPIEELPKYHDDKILVITTGGQGEPNAGVAKMVNGEHKQVTIKEGDTFVFSASVIPGNERDLQVLQDNLCRQGAIVIKSSMMDIHSSGHAPADDLKMVMQLMKPKFFLPCHGYYFMRAANRELAKDVGIPKERTLLSDNGLIVEMTPDSARLTKEMIPSSFMMVDGLGVGDVEEVVLRDRKSLAEEGMLIAIATISRRDGQILKNPDIISRGFIHLKNNQEFVEEMREKTKFILAKITQSGTQPDPEYVKTMLREQLANYILTKTQRRPMIIPVIIEI